MKPCPFCKGLEINHQDTYDGAETSFWMRCATCFATGPHLPTQEGALFAWELRVPTETPGISQETRTSIENVMSSLVAKVAFEAARTMEDTRHQANYISSVTCQALAMASAGLGNATAATTPPRDRDNDTGPPPNLAGRLAEGGYAP